MRPVLNDQLDDQALKLFLRTVFRRIYSWWWLYLWCRRSRSIYESERLTSKNTMGSAERRAFMLYRLQSKKKKSNLTASTEVRNGITQEISRWQRFLVSNEFGSLYSLIDTRNLLMTMLLMTLRTAHDNRTWSTTFVTRMIPITL